ncbi:L-fuculose-phosphate aldolase [Thermodesulfobium acidiphilum]|uniref:L-fuculose-phosphate aldolase n=1 Tax=Thermodesulfobium acidiphilum TaxID=1794699 RepID=A0A2R4W109_THEAF|nr:class II aldolase/adducin family protein [Thermodesulfobium acidiphilum]AWB10404.1 L-fuculose-phosphate aldolase [Thermodesulfobium acidiphilum]
MQPRFDLFVWSQIAYLRGLARAKGGNISLFKNNKIYIKPSGFSFFDVLPWKISIIDIDGTFKNNYKPSSEYPMHLEIYRKLPFVKAIFHTHSFYATLFALLRITIPVFTEEARIYLKEIPLIPFAQPGSSELGKKVVEHLSNDVKVGILENHGTIVVGKTLKECYYLSELLEESAKLAWHLKLFEK